MLLVFEASSMIRTCFRRFLLLSLNWQVLKVLMMKFQVSTLDQCHHLLINLSCKSASKLLHAQYCTWARNHRDRLYDCACCTVFTHFWCAPTQHVQPKPSSDFVLRHWLPKYVSYKTFARIRSGSRCHLIFGRFIHVCSW